MRKQLSTSIYTFKIIIEQNCMNVDKTKEIFELVSFYIKMNGVIKIIYILEFKLTETAKEAIEQIKRKEYYNKYLLDNKKIVLIGVQFDWKTGMIKEWEIENL